MFGEDKVSFGFWLKMVFVRNETNVDLKKAKIEIYKDQFSFF